MESVRKILKKIPGLHKAYRSTRFYKAKEQRYRDRQNILLAAQEEQHRHLFRVAFHNDLTVRFGPFAGMRYLNAASGSQVLPKVLGSYEEPIQPWIEEMIRSEKYNLIIDVGCAEGYYAVGFAFRMPQVRVYAYDIDPLARERAKELIHLNNVEDRVILGSECTFEVLQEYGGTKTLVFCDTEGGEDLLLDPVKAPSLTQCGILVEAHDYFVPGVSDRLIARFSRSHRIHMVVDYPGRLGSYPLPQIGTLTSEERAKLMDEIRVPQMRFILMEPLVTLSPIRPL